MADALSLVANVVAVVSFAGESSKFLFDFFCAVSDAPDEIRHQVDTLRTLCVVFDSIHALGPRLPPDHAWPSDFQNRLKACTADLHTVESKLKKLEARLEKGRLWKKMWAKVRWAADDRYWDNFFARVQTYHATFSLDLLILSIKLGLPPANASSAYVPSSAHAQAGLISPKAQGQRVSGGSSTIARLNLHSKIPIKSKSPSLSSPSGQYSRDITPSPIYCCHLDASNCKFSSTQTQNNCHLGYCSSSQFVDLSVVTKHVSHYLISLPGLMRLHVARGRLRCPKTRGCQEWSCEPKESSSGHGLIVIITTPFGKCLFSLQFQRMVRQFQEPAMSLNWSLRFPTVVSRDATIVRLVRIGDVDGVRKLFIENKARPSDMMQDGTGLLHCAARSNNLEMVRYLIESGADVNAPDDDGETPLHAQLSSVPASSEESSKTSMYLIARGSDVMAQSTCGATPLHNFYTPTLESILNHHSGLIDIDVDNATDNQGMTFFHYIAWSSKSSVSTARLYLDTHAGPALLLARDYAGRIPLHLAAQRGNLTLTAYMLNLMQLKNIDRSQQDDVGRSAMHYALGSRKRGRAIVEILVANGVSVHTKDILHRTPLHHAALRGDQNLLETLLKYGATADLTSQDINGNTPLDIAQRRIQRDDQSDDDKDTAAEIVRLLLESQAVDAAATIAATLKPAHHKFQTETSILESQGNEGEIKKEQRKSENQQETYEDGEEVYGRKTLSPLYGQTKHKTGLIRIRENWYGKVTLEKRHRMTDWAVMVLCILLWKGVQLIIPLWKRM